MPTLGDLIENTRHMLSGMDAQKDAVAALSAPVAETDLTIAVDGAESASVGFAEIDFEVVRIKNVQPQDGSLVCWPFGRGYRGTTAVAHATGAEVRFNPSWPASTVAREINGVLTEIYPTLYGVSSYETTMPSDLRPVQIPGEAVGIVSVWVESPRRDGTWVREDRWDFNADGATDGRGLRIGGLRLAGDKVRVVYATRPELFDLAGPLDQDFASTTLLDTRVSDLILLGVARRLAPFIDISKLPYVTAAAADAGGNKSSGDGGTAARLIHQLYQARLASEAAVLKDEHPIRVHWTR